MSVAVIEAKELSKRYGRRYAVHNVDFRIQSGEIVGFLGPNGAGKTTTMRMLAGLIRPSSGTSYILGKRSPSSSLKDIGTMIEEPAFYPYMNGRDNLRYIANLYGGVSEVHIDEMLDFVSMDKAANKRVKTYSQGMRQRLALARALLWRPKILLLDEPTNGLDPVGIVEIRERLIETAKQGTTILISSHILAELEKLVNRVLVIERGKLLFDGPLMNLTTRLDSAQINYQLLAVDNEKLQKVLEAKGHSIDITNTGLLRVSIPAGDSRFLSRLAEQGVDVLEAHREVPDLESAYLQLLKEDGRPV